jgi:hypothetical protein
MIVVKSVPCQVALSSESGHRRSISWMNDVGDVLRAFFVWSREKYLKQTDKKQTVFGAPVL